jgi:hypothetical protein
MVGNEKGERYFGGYLPSVCNYPECGCVKPQGAGFLECRYPALEGKSRADDVYTKDQAAAEASPATGLYDARTGRPIPLESPTNPAPIQIFSDRLVFRVKESGDHWSEVVDDQS